MLVLSTNRTIISLSFYGMPSRPYSHWLSQHNVNNKPMNITDSIGHQSCKKVESLWWKLPLFPKPLQRGRFHKYFKTVPKQCTLPRKLYAQLFGVTTKYTLPWSLFTHDGPFIHCFFFRGTVLHTKYQKKVTEEKFMIEVNFMISWKGKVGFQVT